MSKALEETSLGATGTTTTSSGSPPQLKKREKTIPHYLRASTGSCHDLCKYGHKNPSKEELRFSGGRRKKLLAHHNNLALHKSATLDRSKDVRNRNLSVVKSSISLDETEWVAPNITSVNHKGATSNENLVPHTATSAEHNILNNAGSKKHSMVAEKVPTNLRYSNGIPKCDKNDALQCKTTIYPAKSKVPEKTLPLKPQTHSMLQGSASSSTELNRIKKVPVTKGNATSQVSSHHLRSSKDKSTTKGKATPPSAAVNRERAKSGKSPMRSSNANTNGKEVSDISRPSFSMECEFTASVEIQENLHVTGYSVESLPVLRSSDPTECVGNSRPAPQELSKSISDDDMLGSTENTEALAGEASIKVDTAIELQRSLDGKELNAVPQESSEPELAEQDVMDFQGLKDEDNQTDDASLCQLPDQLITVENADVYDPVFTQSNSKIEDDHTEANLCVESLNADGKEEVEVHEEDLQRSVEIVALDEKHVEEHESCLNFASENAAENDKADEILNSRTDICALYYNSISEISSDGEHLQEPKSMPIKPSDSIVQPAALASVSNENIEAEGLKSRIIIPQLPEELSDDEFFEEYDFEFSESDESGTDDEEPTAESNNDESVKASDQKLRRIAAIQVDDANTTPYKLKFKRGKVVELPADYSGPRRLKFRRKAANEVLNSESQLARRIYKRSSTNNVVPANPDVESSGVKLRHQDAQAKKDAQGLFNNVIEVTASKLVESRKSKVKALVGAFETVISLQDNKPTSQAPDSVHDGEGNTAEE